MELHIEEVEHNVLIVAVDGGLDGTTAPQLTQGLEKMLSAGMNQIILDFSKVSFISSLGIGTLITLHRRMKKRGGDVKLASLQGVVWEVLRTARLDSLLEIYPDVNRARLAFRPPDLSGG